MAMTKNQLQKECRKQKVARSSLPSSPNKKDLVDLLLLKEFASQKKENANDKNKKGSGVKDGDVPEYQRRSTWKSDVHINRNHVNYHNSLSTERQRGRSRKHNKKVRKDPDIPRAKSAKRTRNSDCGPSDEPEFRSVKSVPIQKRGRTRMRSNTVTMTQRSKKKRGTAKRSSSSTKKRNGKNDLPKMSTWKSDDHRNRHLKHANEKKSFRYNESLPVKNDRVNAVFAVLKNVESEKVRRKKKAKLEKGKSLVGDELKVVEQDAIIDTLGQHYDSKKKNGGKFTENDIAFHMVASDGESEEEISLNGQGR